MDRRGGTDYTVTFFNNYDLDEEECREIFEAIGRVVRFGYKNNRFFVSYRDRDQALDAIEKYGEKYRVEMARSQR